MVRVRPFKAIRPNKEYVDKVAALPYDTMDTEEARKMAKNNPYSYLRIDRAEIDLDKKIDIHDKKVYEKARQNLNKFIEEKILVEDDEPALYIYREIMNDRIQIGIVGAVSVDESIDGTIKKHEHTKPDKVEDRTKHIEYCQAHTGTILLTYENDKDIDNFIEEKIKVEPEYDFSTDDMIRHTVWLLDKEESKEVESLFKNVKSLYIADGHHRSAAAENYAMKKREENPNYNPEDEFNFYIAMIAPKKNLYVMDYNRLVKDTNNYTKEYLLNKIEENFQINSMKKAFRPCNKYEYAMYLDKEWHRLKFMGTDNGILDSVKRLDVSVLHDYLIEPILEIDNPHKNDRIDFVGGIRGLDEIENKIDNGKFKLAFILHPTELDELIEVADEGKIMPAKSTWFEPKVRCGLFVHRV
ncbi:DUF1015 domain-containing protein [Peptostreptococcus equinus]|uniref:DUF1015 family protein n=1 Tax=Peptostreptococcus equinus TaxID=3003601 RepID=A0ABY7JNM8_9FIRM|nr:DUF1015 family protein [Peptostreptococcus sp. CBA3647]WAW14779.1 DUF1015 family protein [Peptostreptococcus sp. CBA3647]